MFRVQGIKLLNNLFFSPQPYFLIRVEVTTSV